ncbi:MAG: Re/Si-specific NAD(P)(+) transhydrogenase subunit alpha [Actinomycetes bacterium]|jgi:NAD(P) transhydrogenase subunit alpha|nr:MAG: Re/Si-specific NAD(P)(+) transhydrogenase subunit alpha [Actinomycetota bacterium]
MLIVVPAEPAPERRVAMTPAVVTRLVQRGHRLLIESGAGSRAGFSDQEYADAGAELSTDPLSAGAELTLVVGPPATDLVAGVPEGSVLCGFLDPFRAGDLMSAIAARRITAFAMEAIPRTTLAQAMDALSSQATAAGYAAVLEAAYSSPRIFPMLTTAAGTLPPAKVLVLGAGVAGLHAIATARRLGAVVSAYDIRPAVREQIESLGARAIDAPMDESAATASGYAKSVGDETQRRQMDALAPHVAEADVVITTAQVPGQPAPLLVSREMVESMKPGSVIVDIAARAGGNCELTRPGETVVHDGVTIVGPIDLPSRVALDASSMYARNLANFIERIADPEGGLKLDFEDPIVSETCVSHDGRITHPVVRKMHGLEEEDS